MDNKKQYMYEDTQLTKNIEKKHLYLSIMNFNEYYYICYSNINCVQRNSYGQIILEKLSNMLSIISNMYFSNYNKDTLNNLYLILKDVEFHIRLCYKLHIFSKKQILNLSRHSAELSNYIKEFMNMDELCKQS